MTRASEKLHHSAKGTTSIDVNTSATHSAVVMVAARNGMNDRSGAPDRGAVRGGLERPGRGLFTAGILAEFAGFSKTVVGSQGQNP